MAPRQPDRILALLAAARATEKELKDLIRYLRNINDDHFLHVVRSFELRIREDGYFERDEEPLDYILDDTFKMFEDFRTKEVRMPILSIVDQISRILSKIYSDRNVPIFNQKQGLRRWIANLLDIYTPSEIYQAVAVLRESDGRDFQRSWSINRKT